jgi:glycosyltransferase involved in cell wall biosynthesis
MNIAFLSLSDIDFNAASPLAIPLGGSESAACGLAAALARIGHRVYILSKTSDPGRHLGVDCIRWEREIDTLWQLNLDAAVVIRITGNGKEIRKVLPPRAALVQWCQDDHSQGSAQGLKNPEEHDACTGVATVSYWQREQYHEELGVPLEKMAVMRNAISSSFENLFAPAESIIAAKERPPVIAYTSTPFRGLEILLDLFPSIRAAVPGTRLKVFSSMKVYQVPTDHDRDAYGTLYERCQKMEGVEYIGSLPQPQLAAALKGATALTYPNTFPETSCISAMEAMAAGCRLITTYMAALPETTAGYADLVQPDPGFHVYRQAYLQTVINVLNQFALNSNNAVENFLRRQVAYANSGCNWDLRAREWDTWLRRLLLERWAATSQ